MPENSVESFTPCKNKGTLGRKYLKSFASGLAFKFAVSAEHFAWMALCNKISDIYIDLINLTINPKIFEIERNINLVQMCNYSLMRSIERLKPPASIKTANLHVSFGISGYTDTILTNRIGQSTFSVNIVDDRMKVWSAKHTEKNILAMP